MSSPGWFQGTRRPHSRHSEITAFLSSSLNLLMSIMPAAVYRGRLYDTTVSFEKVGIMTRLDFLPGRPAEADNQVSLNTLQAVGAILDPLDQIRGRSLHLRQQRGIDRFHGLSAAIARDKEDKSQDDGLKPRHFGGAFFIFAAVFGETPHSFASFPAVRSSPAMILPLATGHLSRSAPHPPPSAPKGPIYDQCVSCWTVSDIWIYMDTIIPVKSHSPGTNNDKPG